MRNEQNERQQQVAETTVKAQHETSRETDEEVITTREEFDTTQPVDEHTGTPPLKSRTTQTRRTREKVEEHTTIEQDAAATISSESSASTQSETSARTDSTIKVRQDEKRGLNGWQRALCSIGILALLYIGIKLLLKHLKRFIL